MRAVPGELSEVLAFVIDFNCTEAEIVEWSRQVKGIIPTVFLVDAKGDFFGGDELGLWIGVTVTERGVGLKLDGDYLVIGGV